MSYDELAAHRGLDDRQEGIGRQHWRFISVCIDYLRHGKLAWLSWLKSRYQCTNLHTQAGLARHVVVLRLEPRLKRKSKAGKARSRNEHCRSWRHTLVCMHPLFQRLNTRHLRQDGLRNRAHLRENIICADHRQTFQVGGTPAHSTEISRRDEVFVVANVANRGPS